MDCGNPEYDSQDLSDDDWQAYDRQRGDDEYVRFVIGLELLQLPDSRVEGSEKNKAEQGEHLSDENVAQCFADAVENDEYRVAVHGQVECVAVRIVQFVAKVFPHNPVGHPGSARYGQEIGDAQSESLQGGVMNQLQQEYDD